MTFYLDQSRLNLLETEVLQGDRNGYFSLLSSWGDSYATLALEVVNSSGISGRIANVYMSETSLLLGRVADEDSAQAVGLSIIQQDLAARFSNLSSGRNGLLDNRDVEGYHKLAFEENNILVNCWTAYDPLLAAENNWQVLSYIVPSITDAESAREHIWNKMIDGDIMSSIATGISTAITQFLETYASPWFILVSAYIVDETNYVLSGNGSPFPPDLGGLLGDAFDISNKITGNLLNSGYTVDTGIGDDTIFGSQYSDNLSGGDHDDLIFSQGGSDEIYGGAHNDRLYGGIATDTNNNGVFGEIYIDALGNYVHESENLALGDPAIASVTLYGGSGNDYIVGGRNQDSLFGGADDDTIMGSVASDSIYGDDEENVEYGNDSLSGQGGSDTLYGGKGDDYLFGGSDEDSLLGGDGFDQFDGGEDSDRIYGGNNNDIIFGGSESDKLYGDEDNDELHGYHGNDTLYGGIGVDELYGGIWADTLEGGDDNDFLYGGQSNDLLKGGTGSDKLYGGDGNDNLYGESGYNYLYGESGNDIFYGGNDGNYMQNHADNATMFGGSGVDKFAAGTQNVGTVTIKNFQDGIDFLMIDQNLLIFGNVRQTEFSLDNSSHVQEINGDTIITFNNGGSMIIENATNLNSADWNFYYA